MDFATAVKGRFFEMENEARETNFRFAEEPRTQRAELRMAPTIRSCFCDEPNLGTMPESH